MSFACLLQEPEPMPEAPQPPTAMTLPPVMEMSSSVSDWYFVAPPSRPVPEPMPAPLSFGLLLSEYP